MKKLAFVLLAALVLGALPGCSVFSGLVAEPVTIRFVYLESAADYAPLAEAFMEKNPNITVELDPVSAAGGNPMDVLESKAAEADAVRLPAMQVGDEMLDAFLPLDSYLTTAQDFPSDDLFPGSLEGLRAGGKQVGIPAALNPYVFYFDPLKFNARGVTPPSPSWTVEEFVSVMMAMNNTDDALIGSPEYTFGFCSTPQSYDAIILSYVFGGGVFDNLYAPTNPTLNNPANVEALTWYAGLREEFGLMPPFSDARQVGELVVGSNCGFWMDWLDRSTFARFMQGRAVAALPLPRYNAPFSISTLEFYSILVTSQHPDETWKWLRFLMDQPSAAGSLVPPRPSHATSSEYAAHTRPDVLGIAQTMPAQGVVLGLETIQDSRLGMVLELYARAAVQVLDGGAPAQTVLDEAQEQAVQAFEK